MIRWFQAMIGHSRPERVFSVGHTGGDLSLPDEVKAKVMPSAFPVADGTPDWAERVRSAEAGGAATGPPAEGAA
jgi:hypothetical protein